MKELCWLNPQMLNVSHELGVVLGPKVKAMDHNFKVPDTQLI